MTELRTTIKDEQEALLASIKEQTGLTNTEFVRTAIVHFAFTHLWGTNPQLAREKAARVLTRCKGWTNELAPEEILDLTYDFRRNQVSISVRQEPRPFALRMSEWVGE